MKKLMAVLLAAALICIPLDMAFARGGGSKGGKGRSARTKKKDGDKQRKRDRQEDRDSAKDVDRR